LCGRESWIGAWTTVGGVVVTSAGSTFELKSARIAGVLEVALSGELDLATRDMLEEVISKVETDPCSVVVDLSELTFLDSAGMVNLVRLAKAATGLELRGANGSVAHVLALTGLDEAYGPPPD
jgi:anti-anti-sigma factor